MQSFLDIETEVKHRQRALYEAAAADAHAARARSPNGRITWSRWPHLILTRLGSRPKLPVCLPAPWTAEEGARMPRA